MSFIKIASGQTRNASIVLQFLIVVSKAHCLLSHVEVNKNSKNYFFTQL